MNTPTTTDAAIAQTPCSRCREYMIRDSLLLFNDFYLLCGECAVEYQQELAEMRDE